MLSRKWYALTRLVRNAVFDLRYGGWLGGSVANRYPGATTVGNSDYGIMDQVFPGRISSDDVLVDVGCGKGRVLNWWLRHYPAHRIYGLEIMEEVAERTARRLRGYRNVTVVSGDAIAQLPVDGTLFYLFNPFDAPTMERFKNQVRQLAEGDARKRILYYAPVNLDVFTSDPAWVVTIHAIHPGKSGRFEERHARLAEIRLSSPLHEMQPDA